jgi:hypothetical protein
MRIHSPCELAHLVEVHMGVSRPALAAKCVAMSRTG